jgi:hypothetical protein
MCHSDVTRYVRRTRFVAVLVIPNPHTVSLGLSSPSHSSGEDPDVPQKVGNPQQMHQNQDQDQETSQSPSQPPSSPIPLTKQRTRNAPFVPVPYRPRSEYVLWLLPFFLFRHVFTRLDVSTESRGSGSSFDRSFRHMSHACSEPRARSSRGHRRLRRTM